MDEQSPISGSGTTSGDEETADTGDHGRAVVTRLRDPGPGAIDRESIDLRFEGNAEDEATRRVLIERFRNGDPEALGQIFDLYAGAVFSLVLSVLGDRGSADDAVQETFVRAWRSADRFDPSRPMSPWLFTIARRTAIDIHRREMRPTRGDHAVEQDVVIDGPGIETSWQRWEIQRALGRLEPGEREVVKLSHFYGFTHSQIASRFGVPIGTIKSRSYRAHRRLAAMLRHLDSAGE